MRNNLTIFVLSKNFVSSLYFVIRLGRWMIAREGLFVLRIHRAVKHPEITWRQWDKVL